MDQLTLLTTAENTMSRVNMWKIKQRICPKSSESTLSAKVNSKGQLITDKTGLLNLYREEYQVRLRHRNIIPKYEQLMKSKELLFDLRLSLSKMRKTPDWTNQQLSKILRSLKVNRTRDSEGLIYEILRPEVAGSDLCQSLLDLCNGMKSQCSVPEFLKNVQITSIPKNNKNPAKLVNQRGIFNVCKVRSILDKLIYADKYEEIDSTMSDSNVGARKDRNVRDNLFVAYSVINDALNSKEEIDVVSYDLAQAFDSLWFRETMNDLWDAKVQDDKFALISKMNEECNVKVKTPIGDTELFKLKEIEMQGTVIAPIKCSVTTDSIGRYCYTQKKGIFIYKTVSLSLLFG